MGSELLDSLWTNAGGVVPTGWSLAPFEDLLAGPKSIAVGVMYPGSDDPEGVPLIRVGDVKNGVVDTPTMRITPEVHEEYRRTELQGTELLITLVGDPGHCVIAEVRMKGWNAARALAVARLKDPTIRGFIKALFSSPPMRTIIRSMLNTTVQPTLNLKEIKGLPILLAPPEIREGIAETLGILDDKITLLRETNATLEALAQAIFKSWFVDFDPVRAKAEGRDPEGVPPEVADLFPSEFEDSELGAIPKGWRVGMIGEIASIIDCLHSKKPERTESGPTMLQLSNILDNGLMEFSDRYFISEPDYAKWVSRMEASPGDCVITNVGRVGAIAQIPEGERAAMGRNMTGVRVRRDFPYPTFLLECLLSTAMRAEITRLTDVGTILNALNVRSIPQLRFALGTTRVVAAFEDIARPLRRRMEGSLREIGLLADLRDSLLPRLMSGKLRITDVEEILP